MHTIELTTTALNGLRTETDVVFKVKEYGKVNVFEHEEWQGTPERGGRVWFTDAIVIEDLPQVDVLSVLVDNEPVVIDELQRKLIAYQLVNELPQTSEYFIGATA